MNDVIKCIKARRSVRNYSEKQISDDELKTLLEAATWAPSVHNRQPWYFTVIQDRAKIETLNIITKEALVKRGREESVVNLGKNKDFDIFYNAPTVIIVSGENSPVDTRYDCCAAIQNLLLAAESMDLGSCWVGFVAYHFMDEKCYITKNYLDIPERYTPYFAVTIGYKEDSTKERGDRRNEIFNIIRS